MIRDFITRRAANWLHRNARFIEMDDLGTVSRWKTAEDVLIECWLVKMSGSDWSHIRSETLAEPAVGETLAQVLEHIHVRHSGGSA